MIRPYEAWVKLADQKTVVKTKEVVKGMLSFVDDDGKEYSGEVEAIVWEMKGLDFILGLPDIVKSFIHLFFMMLKQSQLDTLASSALESPLKPGQVIQWSDQLEHEAPEESECPMPVAHEPILTFMETSYEDALQSYMDLLKDHVGEHLKGSRKLLEILKSEAATNRFVPKEWKGITGFEPLEFQWKPSFPESHPVRSRPINPKLWDVAKKEFERLCKYNYQPSTSPWASPLVTASKNTPPFVRFCGDYSFC
jgi:hypothetical protein